MKYYVKNTEGGTFQDISTLFDGVRVLKMSGFLERGEPVNIYNEQWVNSQEEDFLITKQVNNKSVVIRKNVDIELTFIVREKYATNKTNFDVLAKYDAFVDYMTGSDIWIKSSYANNKFVRCVCLHDVSPTTIKLQRGSDKSYILATITLHTLNAPQS